MGCWKVRGIVEVRNIFCVRKGADVVAVASRAAGVVLCYCRAVGAVCWALSVQLPPRAARPRSWGGLESPL